MSHFPIPKEKKVPEALFLGYFIYLPLNKYLLRSTTRCLTTVPLTSGKFITI